MKKSSTAILAILLTLFCSRAYALIDVPTFRFALGESPISFTAGSQFPGSNSLGEAVTLNPMFLWDLPGIRSRLGVSFIADLGTKYGAIAIAGVGLTGIFYPLGLSSSREVNEDFSEVVKTRISPYFQFSVTPTDFSVSQQVGSVPQYWPYFSATMIEISLGIGVDYPFSKDLIGFIGLHYRSASFSGGANASGNATGTSSTAPTTNGVNYSGVALLLGVMTNFY